MSISFLAFWMVASGMAQPAEPFRVVQVGVDQAFLPQGFDDNDSVQIVLDGALTDACHQIGMVRRVPSAETRADEIVIEQLAQVRVGGMCAEVMVPFTTVLNLGVLPQREYQIKILKKRGGMQLLGTLPVVHSNSATDDHLYLPVSGAELISARQVGDNTEVRLRLRGTFKNSCMEFERAEFPVSARHNPSAAVVDVLPILRLSSTGCSVVHRPFDIEVTGTIPAVHGRVLFHVRSMSGQAVHVVDDVL